MTSNHTMTLFYGNCELLKRNEMKKLEDLGISPVPWWIGNKDELFFYGSIVCNTKDGKKIVATSNYSFDCHEADDLILSAAPDMYSALWDVCFGESATVNCAKCGGNDHGDSIEHCSKTCPFYKARAALAKANGVKS